MYARALCEHEFIFGWIASIVTILLVTRIWDPDELTPMSFMDYLREYLHGATWLPEPFKESCGISLISAITGRRVCYRHSVRNFYANIYLLLVGDSRCGKGIAIEDVIEDFLRWVSPEYLLAKQYTVESLAKALTEQPHGIICNDEFANIISGKKYMEGMSTLLLSLFQCPPSYTVSLIKGKREIKESYLCLAVGIQPEILEELTNKKELIKSGFMARFLVIHGKKVPPKDTVVRNQRFKVQAKKRLSALKEILELVGPVTLSMEPEGMTQITAFERELDNRYENLISSFFSRTRDLVIKLSMIYHLDEITRIMDFQDIKDNKKKVVSNKSSIVNSQSVNNRILHYNQSSIRPFFRKDADNRIPHFQEQKEVFGGKYRILHLPKNGEKDLISLWKSIIEEPISVEVVSKSLDFLRSTDTARVSLFRTIATSPDTRMLEKVSRAIDELVEQGRYEYNNNLKCIRRRELTRVLGLNMKKISWAITQLQEEGTIGELVTVDRKKLYPYLKEETLAREVKKNKRLEEKALRLYDEIKDMETFSTDRFYCKELETYATRNGTMGRKRFYEIRKVMEEMGQIREVQGPPGVNKSRKYYRIVHLLGGVER